MHFDVQVELGEYRVIYKIISIIIKQVKNVIMNTSIYIDSYINLYCHFICMFHFRLNKASFFGVITTLTSPKFLLKP